MECCLSLKEIVLIHQRSKGEGASRTLPDDLDCKFLIYLLNRELDLLPSIISVVLLKASHNFVVLFDVLSSRLSYITCYIALERLCSSCLCAGYSFGAWIRTGVARTDFEIGWYYYSYLHSCLLCLQVV